jgi:ribose 1,5-bisphosphokinase PhnN
MRTALTAVTAVGVSVRDTVGAATARGSVLKEFCSREEISSAAVRWVRVKHYYASGVKWHKGLRDGCVAVIRTRRLALCPCPGYLPPPLRVSQIRQFESKTTIPGKRVDIQG